MASPVDFISGPNSLFTLGEFVEGEHGFLDGVALLVRLEVEVPHFLLTQHHLGSVVDVGFAVGFADEGHRTRSARGWPQ